ncbi:MAG: flagellar FliJ family protein [Pirellulaceae bacterium]|nr:flagellar FliJ family protein [Pirellulaceae bacterium]
MSPPFRFASILQLRIRERDLAASAVEEVVRAMAMIDSQVDEARMELQSLVHERKMASTGNVAVSNLLDFQRHQLVLMGNIQFLTQQRSTLLQEKQRRESKLMKAQQAMKSFENLSEQQQNEAQRLGNERLQSRLDEWSNTRSVVKNNNGGS